MDKTWLDAQHALSEAWFDVDGKPYHLNNDTYVKVEREYDENGNISVIRYYGEDGKPVALNAGYDELHQVVNEKKQVVRIEYYLGGERVITNSGFSAVEKDYDENGNVIEERHYGTDNELIQHDS